MARGGSKRHPFAIAPFAYNIPGAALPHDTDSELALDPALTVFYPEEDLELPSRDSEDSDKDDEDDGNSENPPERPKEWQIVTSVRPMNDAPSMSGDENFLTDSDKENSNEDQSDSSDLDLSPDEFPSEDEEADSRARRRGPQRRGPTRGRGGKGGASTQSKETIRGVKGPPDGNTRKTPSKRSKKYKTPEQTAEFRRINGLVTAAWLKEDYDTALRHARDAVQLDPTHFSLHATIADILQMKGREKDATDALFVGIQFTKIPQNWWYVVDHLSTLKSNLKATRKKLIYCYTNILRMPGGDHYQARIRRMRCYQEHGSYRRAQVDCIALLKLEPGNVELLKTLAELSNTLEDPVGALEPFESFVQLNMEHSYSEESALSWEIASIYIELLAQAEKLEDGIDTLRRVSRWILGREEENYWDDLKDDREWDIDDSRRIKADSFEADRFDTELYGLGLPIEFRVRLATLRIQLQPSNIIEAMRHLDLLCPEDHNDASKVEDFVELFLAAAETLRQYNHHAEALRFYEPLRNVAETLDAGFYFELAICYQALDRQEDVREAIEGIKHGDRSAGAQLGLAKLYHSQGKVELMWRVCAQMRRAGRSDLLRQAGLPTRKPLEVTSKPNRPFSVKNDGPREFRRGHILREEEEQHELLRDQVIRAMWDDLSPLEHPLVEPNPERNQEWLSIANELYQDFRSQIAFYPSDKNSPFTGYGRYKFSDTFDPNASSRENKLAYKLPTTYRKISFDDWTDFLMHFAIRLAEKGDRKKCSMVLKGAELANIINTDPKRYYLLRTVSLRCAITSNDEERVCRESRWFTRRYSMSTDTARLSTAANRAMHILPAAFHSGAEQKHSLRQVKTMDWGVLNTKGEDTIRNKMFGSRPQSQIQWNHDCHDPSLFAQYAHLMLLGFAPNSGLNYYFRAYTLSPDDPVVNMHLGLSYISLALKRQSSNRQYHIQQGLCFMQRYYEMRQASSQAIIHQEADFNMGMVFHSLGVFHQAISFFEKVLAMSEEVQKEATMKGLKEEEIENFAPEAAMGIRSIMAFNGDVASAHALSEKYLIL